MNGIKFQLQKATEENLRQREEIAHLKGLLNSPSENTNPNRIITKKSNLKDKIHLYRNFFKGREDVFALRFESTSGKSGYKPACDDNINRKFLPITDQAIYHHLTGKLTMGIYPILKDGSCWFLAVDFDKKDWQEDATAFLEACQQHGVYASIERSRSGNGCHVWIFFKQALPASISRKLGFALLSSLKKKEGIKINSFDRLFPNQDTLPEGGFGNLIALPFQQQPGFQGNSVFIDEHFVPFPDQWLFLSGVEKMNLGDVNKVLDQFKDVTLDSTDFKNTRVNETSLPYPAEVMLVYKNGISIDKQSVPSSLLHDLIQLGTLDNPEFFKLQKRRLSTHGISRKIDCTEDQPTSIILPRGCLEDVKKLFNRHSVKTIISDERALGEKFEVIFEGDLRPEQQEAVIELLQHDNGILSATTGFGKTVVAASLIAERKVNTLIIVHRKQLIEQWTNQLSSFFNVDPKSIGRIGGGKNKPSGKLDIATIQSLNHNNIVKDNIKQYGQIIVDECHHMAAFSFEKVLKHAQAKYICGLTATLVRKDGLHPIITMQLGPVRFKVNAKKQVQVRPFEHVVIPRFTQFRSLLKEEQKTFQGISEELIQSEKRHDLIFNDILKSLDSGRSPLVITERLAHVENLNNKLKGFVKNLIILTGGMTAKQERDQLNRLKNLPEDEERLIVATGKYIGEGFDDPRLDTLFITLPVSWKGTLSQYVGRLHRLHDNKEIVQVYDYVDHLEPMLKKMYENRLKSYKNLGYKLPGDAANGNEQMRLF